MTLLILPVRPGDSNEELRYALRSWETNLHVAGQEGLRLMTVGYQPKWLEPDIHVDGNRFASVALVVWDNIILGTAEAIAQGFANEDVLYMNDDFFCMDPVGCVLPVKRNSTLAQHIAQFPEQAGLWWPRSLRLTASFLAEQGFNDPDSYEAHRPLFATPSAMYNSLMEWNETSQHWTPDLVPQWRTVYGVLNQIEAYPVVDAKLGPRSPGVGTPWISTSDQSWRRYAPDITRRFQKPSRWER